MAFADISGIPLLYPGALLAGNNSWGTFNALTMDAEGEMVAFRFPAPKSGTINRVGFRFGTVTQAPTEGLTVSFQAGDGTGLPDGTPTHSRLVEAGSIVANTWVSTGLITDDGTDTGSKKTVTRGESLYAVIEFAAFALSDALQIAHQHNAFYSHLRTSVYALLFTSSWAKQAGPVGLVFAVEYEDDGWVPIAGCVPTESNSSIAMSSASNPNERGMKFTLPGGLRVNGFIVHKTAAGTTGTFQLFLYDGSDNVLASTNDQDPDEFSAAGNAGFGWYPFENVAQVELNANTTYRVAIKATGAGNIALNGVQPDAFEHRSAMPWGTDAVQTVRGGGAWTDDSTTGIQYFIGLTIDGISSNSGGSGTTIIRRFYED